MKNTSKVLLALSFVLIIALTGCGQKGNLYLPSENITNLAAE